MFVIVESVSTASMFSPQLFLAFGTYIAASGCARFAQVTVLSVSYPITFTVGATVRFTT